MNTTISNIDKFKAVGSQMLWRGSALAQIDEFEKAVATLAERLHVTADVVNSHRSKSIDLPVVKLSTAAGEFTLRDNFHDVNLMAILKNPSTLSLEQFFFDIQEPLTWDWYLAEIDRARNYSWREWTDQEMDDPRILRVRDRRPECSHLWWVKEAKVKDRWAARHTNPAWYTEDWARSELTWEGSFSPGVKLFCQKYAHAEGITVKTSNRKYVSGTSKFIIATSTLADAVTMIERLTSSHLGADPTARS